MDLDEMFGGFQEDPSEKQEKTLQKLSGKKKRSAPTNI